MKVKQVFLLSFTIVFVVILTSCQAIFPALAPATTVPTYTLYPTYTEYPTPTEAPTLAPTATSIPPTATDTAVPTATKKPYVPPAATKAPAQPTSGSSGSSGSTPVTWNNETSHVIKIVASGPANYTLTLGAHEEKMVYWNSGTYTVLYYLDGSSSVGGYDTIKVDPEEHNLYTLNFR
jgi:hypothetical protein